MALYKGVQIDDALAGLIDRMPNVGEYQESLQSLQSVWDNLTLLGHLSGTGADMSDTRAAFQQLTGSLLNQLGRETLKKTVLEMKSKAQVAVDIMVRNLFERTADIGFLAMDGEVRDYLLLAEKLRGPLGEGDPAAQAELAQRKQAMLARFGEYVRKYSVYSNIILLDTRGDVLLQLDDAHPLPNTRDPLVAESLSTSGAYVESFRKTELMPDEAAGLVYSYRVTDAQGRGNLGVLCLCFHFVNETERIFANLAGPDDWSVVTLLNAQGRVIASSDPYHVPVGAPLERVLDTDWKVVRFAGREYLAATCATQGYQGYMGPGWYGHVMLPLDHAFGQATGQALEGMPAGALEAVTANRNLFGDALRAIPAQAGHIQRGLNRSVWNGNIRQSSDRQAPNAGFSKVLLWEISSTGFKTQDIFERSIDNLYQTVVSSILRDSQFKAALAIDIMDRNLYERANDCRWWALAPVFRRVLAGGVPDEAGLREMSETLAHINGLYTVYDNLVVFDKTGCAQAVSNPQYEGCCGQMLLEDWVRPTLALKGSESYAVSGFSASPLYKGQHTYVYAAAIFDPRDERKVVGGIGIVFDSAPQFTAMLADALPRDEKGDIPAGCFGVFADRERRVIASTHAELPAGASIELEERFFQLGNGASLSAVTEFNGSYYAVGACMSQGYREYKGEEDAYRNDVTALIFVPLGEKLARERRAPMARRGRSDGRTARASISGDKLEIATFYVDDHWVGIPSEHVIEAIDVKDISRVPGAGEGAVGYLMFRDQPVPVVGLSGLLGESGKRSASREPQVVILELATDALLGVMVDELGEIPEIDAGQIEQVSGILGGEHMLTEGLVKPEEGQEQTGMIMLVSPDRLRRRFLAAVA